MCLSYALVHGSINCSLQSSFKYIVEPSLPSLPPSGLMGQSQSLIGFFIPHTGAINTNPCYKTGQSHGCKRKMNDICRLVVEGLKSS